MHEREETLLSKYIEVAQCRLNSSKLDLTKDEVAISPYHKNIRRTSFANMEAMAFLVEVIRLFETVGIWNFKI